jgi:hypothetical protein
MRTQETDSLTKDYYNDRLKLIEQDGWRALVKEMKELEDLYNNLDSIESEKDLWFAKGQLSILRQIVSLEDATKAAAEELDII